MENLVKILAINPGSTSTKVALFEGEQNVFQKNLKHTSEELAPFEKMVEQFEFRKTVILNALKEAGVSVNEIKYVVGRGGLVKPIPSGIYEVNETLIVDLKKGVQGEHASNLGGLIAYDIAGQIEGCKAFIADPVVVDELQDLARLSGHPAFERTSIFHALNQKAIARTYAKEHGKKYEELNLIVAHLGGGVSVGAHLKGRVIDVNNALDGDGPFSPERAGDLPVGQLLKACFSGKYTYTQMKKMVCGQGGYVAYLNTNDAYDVEVKAKDGDGRAAFIQEGMVYQVAKTIGAMSTVLHGKVDAILVTGGIAYGKPFVASLKEKVGFIAPMMVYPGEDEMKSLAMNAWLLHNGELKAKKYC